MFKKNILTFIAIFFIAAGNLVAQTKPETKLPDSPAGKRADALLKTIAQGDEASIRKFIEEQFSEGLRNSAPMEQLIFMVQRWKKRLEGMEITGVKSPDSNTIEVAIKTAAGENLQLSAEVTPNAPNLLDGLGLLRSANSTAAPQPTFSDKPDLVSPGVVDAENRGMIIESALSRFNEMYVFPEVAKEMEKAIRERMQKKEYDNITDADAFAKKLTEDLQAVSRDKHMSLEYSANLSVGNNPRDFTPADRERARLNDIRSNYGFAKVEHLPGNVGYLDLRQLYQPQEAAYKLTAAMNLLSDTDALIIDVRKSPGGSAAMVALIMSYLMGPEPVLLNTIYHRRGNTPSESWTLKDIPGKRYTGKNVYVLTSAYTFSAAEELAYDLQTQKRGTAVGETTAGGANPNTYVRISRHFQLSIPIGHAINPITKTNWEGVGVKPDVSVPAELALKTAQALALRPY
jgi:retinol-binding protein 3